MMTDVTSGRCRTQARATAAGVVPRSAAVLTTWLAGAGLDPKAGTADVAGDRRRAIETLLTRAKEVGAVRPDLHLPELLGLLAAICMAAERDQWDEGLRTRTPAFVFDRLRPHH